MSDVVLCRADRAIEAARHIVSAAELAVECSRYTCTDAGLRRTLRRPPRDLAVRAVPAPRPVQVDDATDAALREHLARRT